MKNIIIETVNHEYYVSLEVAKLLAEVGFDWECKTYYDTSLYRDEIIIEDELCDYNFHVSSESCILCINLNL